MSPESIVIMDFNGIMIGHDISCGAGVLIFLCVQLLFWFAISGIWFIAVVLSCWSLGWRCLRYAPSLSGLSPASACKNITSTTPNSPYAVPGRMSYAREQANGNRWSAIFAIDHSRPCWSFPGFGTFQG